MEDLRFGAVVRALGSHEAARVLFRTCDICGLSLLLVLVLPRGFFSGVLRFSFFLKNQRLQIPN